MNKVLILTLLVFTFFAFTSIERSAPPSPPGVIEVIGDAGSPNIFTFRDWSITSLEIPEDKIENISLTVEIKTGSLSCSWKDLEKNVKKKKDYFHVKKFPRATISINGAEARQDGSYKTSAMLTLKGFTKPVELTFTVTESSPYKVVGEGVIQRSQFGFTGGGPKEEVPVHFEVVLPD